VKDHVGPGRLIVIEGLDGAGTTTQIGLLGRRLGGSGHVYVTHEPSEGPIGLVIRTALEQRITMSHATIAALFAADRMDHLYHRDGEGGMLAHLARGVHVLTDRYYLSSLAYQGITLDWEWIWDLHEQCIRPDLTLFVDVPVEVCLSRIAARRGGSFDLFENRTSLTAARERYLEAIARLHEERIVVVDGDALPAEVHGRIWQAVEGIAQE
jgi:dTMP kinase